MTTRSPARLLLLPSLSFLLLAGCSVFGKTDVNEPDYQVLASAKDHIEIRRYEPMMLARVMIDDATFEESGERGFRPLFDYISGENTSQQEIAMTAPVLQREESGEKIAMTAPVLQRKERTRGAGSSGDTWSMAFVLPASYTKETAPVPTNPNVELIEQEARFMAVIRFSGRRTEGRHSEHLRELYGWIESNGYTVTSDPYYAGYNSPFTLPMFRRNEILVEIAEPPMS